MENHCNGAGRGTEFDWMGFYWWQLEKGTYTFGNFASLYANTCAGSCASETVSWASTQAAANAVFGATSTKALNWNTNGVNYGVNH
jgi:hypothetical protein